MDIGTSKIITKKEEFVMRNMFGKLINVVCHPLALLGDVAATAVGVTTATVLYEGVDKGVDKICQHIDDQNTMITVKTGIIKTETMTLADWKRQQKGDK